MKIAGSGYTEPGTLVSLLMLFQNGLPMTDKEEPCVSVLL